MARLLPSSLSPHVCILPSPDLVELLESSSLPPLPEILQSFSPLPQVTTRTTSFTSVPQATFGLRFSDLGEIEEACKEDEERRAARMIDWISGRVNKRCAKWVDELEGPEGSRKEKETWRAPWWDEVRRCAEGDHAPSRYEGWNHPVAVILAASTTAPNPLQTITALHSRALQFPAWVDSYHLRYTLIIHPQNSPLSDEEANALVNAVKKQYGHNDVYLLSLAMPSPPPAPVPVPPPLPRLPRPTVPESPPMTRDMKRNSTNGPLKPQTDITVPKTLRLLQSDIQQTSKFVREFVVGCLIPWMEKSTLEWSEFYSSNRRLPSRLFSSTRKLFGSASSSPVATHNPSSSVASLPRSSTSSLAGSPGGPPSQQRRLAEFATILGDLKLAVSVWDTLRKDSKGGSDILPLVSAPSHALSLHASNALSSLHFGSEDLPPQAQMRALLYAVRWETGISPQELLSNVLEGERWLFWAAGNSEEAPAALLIAQAASLTSKKLATRRAAYWYAVAASRLEKCGIKPLTMHFLRKAQELYKTRLPKELSPSFWDAEGKTPEQNLWFDAIMSGIEHPLGRLLYTTGDVLSAVKLFLGLLCGSESTGQRLIDGEQPQPTGGRDKMSLDDFRVAFGHLKTTEPEKLAKAELKLPFKICQVKQSKLRFAGDGSGGDAAGWERREENWKAFWKANGGKEGFAKDGNVVVEETFWVDLVLRNPLDAEVNLANLTLIVEDGNSQEQDEDQESPVDVDELQDVILSPKETRIIPIALRARRAGTFVISQVTYDFISLLPTTERLATRGRRLNATPLQRQTPTYAPDTLMKVIVTEATHKLAISFVEDGRLNLLQGENKVMSLWLSNLGSKPISEIWMVPDQEDELWVGDEVVGDEAEEDENQKSTEITDTNANSMEEVIKSSNSLMPPRPLQIPVPDGVLESEEGIHIPLTIHAGTLGKKEFCLLFVYRENESEAFHTTRISKTIVVHPLFNVSSTIEPDQSMNSQFLVNVTLRNLSNTKVNLTQISTLSPSWSSSAVLEGSLPSLSAAQSTNILLRAGRWSIGEGSQESVQFVKDKLGDVLNGRSISKTDPPHIDLCCSHFTGSTRTKKSFAEEVISTFIHGGRRNFVANNTIIAHPHIPSSTHAHIFPLYHPTSFDIIFFWELDASPTTSTSLTHSFYSETTQQSQSQPQSQIYNRRKRSGHISIRGLSLGAMHAPLESIIDQIRNAKVKRSMYAETVRENQEVLGAIVKCEWNMEKNPLDLVVKGTEEVIHDFSTGPCRKSVDFVIRNHSLTHSVNYVLKLNNVKNSSSPSINSRVLQPPYTGRLNFRGTIPPSESISIHPKLWITRNGTYSLDGWVLETEVYDHDQEDEEGQQQETKTGTDMEIGIGVRIGKVLHRYRQERLVSDRVSLIVRQSEL